MSGCAVLNGTSEYILQFDEAWNDPNRNSDDFIQYKNFSCNETDCCTLGANCLNFIKDFTFSVENPLIVLLLWFSPLYYSYIHDKVASLCGSTGLIDLFLRN